MTLKDEEPPGDPKSWRSFGPAIGKAGQPMERMAAHSRAERIRVPPWRAFGHLGLEPRTKERPIGDFTELRYELIASVNRKEVAFPCGDDLRGCPARG